MSFPLSANFRDATSILLSIGVTLACVGLTLSLALILRQRLPFFGKRTEQEDRTSGRSLLRFSLSGLWLLITALHVAGWQLYWSSEPTLKLDGFLSLLAALVLGWHFVRNGWPLRSGAWSSVGMQTAQVAGLAACAHVLAYSNLPEPLPHTPPGTLVECQTVYTDAGTPIKLYERQVEADVLSQFYTATEAHVAGLAKFAMLRDEAKPQLNCHGWVFSGQHIVKSEDVLLILQENGYQEVTQPQTSDLVVYFGPTENAVHTGIVCGHLRGSALIESKWGLTGTYVHLADEQPYSPDYRFYHSLRAGHHLHPYNPVEKLAQLSSPKSY